MAGQRVSYGKLYSSDYRYGAKEDYTVTLDVFTKKRYCGAWSFCDGTRY